VEERKRKGEGRGKERLQREGDKINGTGMKGRSGKGIVGRKTVCLQRRRGDFSPASSFYWSWLCGPVLKIRNDAEVRTERTGECA